MSDPLPPPPADAARHTIAPEAELRVEVGDAGAFVRLAGGSAEVFGVELAEGRTYALAAGRKLAVFTWSGAELLVWGSLAGAYVSSDSQVPLWANLHQQLEARREGALRSGTQGPRVMVVGPTDSGKSTLCRVLCAYAARVGRTPTFVDLDPGQGEVSIPGTLAATPIDRACLTVDEGFARTTPLVYALGHLSPGEHVPVYRNYIARLADNVTRRLAPGSGGASAAAAAAAAGGAGGAAVAAAGAALARASGCVINTCGWVDAAGYELLLDAARSFGVDVVVVMGHDRVFAALTEDCKSLKGGVVSAATVTGVVPPGAAVGGGDGVPADSGGAGASSSSRPPSPQLPPIAVTVINLARSGGVVERPPKVRRSARAARVRQFFYGPDRVTPGPPLLSPESLTLPWADVTIVRVGGAASEAGLVPIGKASALDPLRVSSVVPSPGALLNQVLGVSFASTDKQVPHVNVAGFVHVRAVDTVKRTITLLAPCAGALPSRFLILGAHMWAEGM